MRSHRHFRSRTFWWGMPLLLMSIASCVVSLPADEGTADISLEISDGTMASVAYEPLLGQIQISPPIESEVEVVFGYDDPYVEVRVRVDAADLQAGETVSLPMTSELPSLQIAVEDGTFASNQDGSSGTITFQVLQVEADYADIDVVYDVTLGEVDGERTLQATGRIATTYGSLLESEEAEVDDPTEE